jgi:hypothetical protein
VRSGPAHTWIRSNILGLVAIFIALGGTAVATQVASSPDPDVAANAAKKKKKAKRGPAGPAGPQGPPGPSTGPAGGALTGNYPNPGIATDAVGALQIDDGSVGSAEFASLPRARVFAASGQTFEDETPTNVNFDAFSYVNGMAFDFATDRITVQVDGIYLLTAEILWSDSNEGTRMLTISSSFCCEIARDMRTGAGGSVQGQTVSTVRPLGAGDELHLSATQNTMGQLATAPTDGRAAVLSATWLGPSS